MQRHPFSITPAFQNKYAISRLAMKTAFLAAVAATVCAEWWMAEEKAPMKTDKLIRRELSVNDPSDPEQVAKTRLKSDCSASSVRQAYGR